MNPPFQVRIGHDTYVCVTLGPLNWVKQSANGSYLRTAAKVVADDLSSVRIRECKMMLTVQEIEGPS